MKQNAPKTHQELLRRARELAGCTMAQLANRLGETLPENLAHDKGWFGQALEKVLGASAGSQPLPDFIDLNVELKTIPVNTQGKPLESTYVCVVPLTTIGSEQFFDSLVWRKLQCVLWMPVEGARNIPLAQRRIGTACLWQPNTVQTQRLQQDWEEFAERIALGQVDTINARLGEVLQIRPKAANSRIVCEGIAADGSVCQTLPRGFYLRAKFTAEILREHFSVLIPGHSDRKPESSCQGR